MKAISNSSVLTVTNLNDSGAGSLRQAIADAVGGDSITFTQGLSQGTITLSGTELLLDKSLTIDGDLDDDGVPDITLDANELSRVLNIDDGTATIQDVTLNGLVVTRGSTLIPLDFPNSSTGGGIRSLEDLTLINSTVVSNRAYTGYLDGLAVSSARGGGIFTTNGELNIINSRIIDNSSYGGGYVLFDFANGGGIDAETVTLIDSTVSGNIAIGEGGVGSGGISADTITLQNSTVSNNEARPYRGPGHGGGIGATTVTSINSTISGNRVYGYGGGIASENLTLINSTVSGNVAEAGDGGGIWINDGDLTLQSSLISGNNSIENSFYGEGLGDEIAIENVVSIVSTNNLLGDNSKTTTEAFSYFTPGPSDVVATSDGNTPTALQVIIDPILGDNGGPTDTHSLQAGSPAIDAGVNPSGLTTDQRGAGFARIVGATIDIGALEQPDPAPTTEDDHLIGTLGDDEIDGLNGSDVINGLHGNDTLIGSPGNDILNGHEDNDILQGKSGNDNLNGGPGNDTIEGDGGEDTLSGGPGDDALRGGPHNDELNGGNGDDTINGGYGNDIIYGGVGNDTLDGVNDKDIIYGGVGNDLIRGGDGRDTLFGENGNDNIKGGNTKDFIFGGDGNDRIDGNGGFDELIGGRGSEINMRGQAGDDLLVGVQPSDVMPGIGEKDRMLGGLGADTFVVGNSESVFYLGTSSIDYADIRDFDFAENDIIQLHGSSTDYSLQTFARGTRIFHDTGSSSDLVAIAIGVGFADFSSGFSFV